MIFGAIDVNPIQVGFPGGLQLDGEMPDTVDVLIDVANSPSVGNFRVALASSDAIVAIDAVSGEQVTIIDESGLTGTEFLLVSQIAAVVGAAYEDFYNYPNPFKPGTGALEGTTFLYTLPQGSQVEFKILTLTGDLVYSQTFEQSSPQAQANVPIEVRWDGYNGVGKMVLNGVYIAVLKTSAGVVTTKVAVRK